MSDPYAVVIGGKLKLKGKPLPGKSKKAKKDTAVIIEDPEQQLKEIEKELIIEDMTPMERHFEEKRKQREQSQIKKMAEKSHREKINELNSKLDQMSEHFDIPRVGPG